MSDHPTYQGRRLPHPGEAVFDQGLGFDLGTLMGRRQMLRAFGAGAAALALAACTDSPAGSSASPAGTPASPAREAGTAGDFPEETAGPYPGDGSNGPDVLERSGIVRSDIRSSLGGAGGTAEGVPMTLELTVGDAGAAVYVWHCDRAGRYSMYTEGVTEENYLRGVQIADDRGKVRFTSVFPACYPGRWPHVHFEVFPGEASITDAGKVILTSQVAIPRETCDAVYRQPGYESSAPELARLTLESDSVFRDDGAARQLATVTGDVRTGFALALTVG